MSVKEYRTYMQARIEDMKTRPKNKGLVLWYIWKENVKCRAVFSSLCKVLNRKLNTSKNKIKLQNKIINRWNIMPL